MNKKKVIIVVIIIVALLLAAGLAFFLLLGKKGGSSKTKLFSDSDYPCEYKVTKSGVELTLDGSKTPDLKWEYEMKRDGIFEITTKSEENKGKVTYNIKVLRGGSTDITFKRKDEFAGYNYDAASVTLTLFALMKDDENYEIVVSEEASVESEMVTKVAGDTDSPFLIVNSSSGNSYIVFPEGSSDWLVNDPSEKIGYSIGYSSDGKETFSFFDYDAVSQMDYMATNSDAVNITAYEAVITMTSEKRGRTEYIKVKVSEKGGIQLSLTEAPKDK
ncbi:MAG: hypothetical protein IJJ74_03785 [Eubacterium sp.]|nr:hypothetical protein [Eubacterium sp.]